MLVKYANALGCPFGLSILLSLRNNMLVVFAEIQSLFCRCLLNFGCHWNFNFYVLFLCMNLNDISINFDLFVGCVNVAFLYSENCW